MIEREFLINMIKRVSGDDSSELFWKVEANGDFTIFNENCEKTTFEFNEAGDLIFFR